MQPTPPVQPKPPSSLAVSYKPPTRINVGLRRLYTILWCVLYLAIFYIFRDIVPDALLRDATAITDLVVTGRWTESESYYLTARILSLIPLPLQGIVVNIISLIVIVALTGTVRTMWGMLIMPVLLIPMMFSSMMAPNKETIVIFITLLVHLATRMQRPAWQVLGLITVLYAFYSLVRIYYVISLALLLSFIIMQRTTNLLRILYIFACFVLFLLLPDSIYGILQGSRDSVASWFYSFSEHQVRTFFSNLYPPDTFWHFVANYFYALVILNFPFVRFATYKEFLLFANVVLWFYIAKTGIWNLRGPERYTILLFVAHLLVANLFEPDFGSYLRHTSSTYVYLIPALAFIEKRRVERSLAHDSNISVN